MLSSVVLQKLPTVLKGTCLRGLISKCCTGQLERHYILWLDRT